MNSQEALMKDQEEKLMFDRKRWMLEKYETYLEKLDAYEIYNLYISNSFDLPVR